MKILIVDDDQVDRQYVVRLIKQFYVDATFLEAASFDIAFDLTINETPDLLLLDYRLPGHTALELLEKFKPFRLGTATVIISENQDPEIAEKCIELGAQDYIMKADITPIRLNTTLRHARQRADLTCQLERLNQHKTQFLRGLSYELTTPLDAIMGFSQFLLSRSQNFNLNDKELAAFHAIATNSEHAVKLIEQLKDIDKIDRGILAIDKSAFDLRQLLAKHRPTIELMLKDTNLAFEVQLPEEELVLISDESRITQAVNHLLVNAIRHTHQGKVVLKLYKQQGNNGEQYAVIGVEDTGTGMPEKEQQALSQQLNSIGERSLTDCSKLGTGLYFCSRLANLLKGHIEFNTQPGRGTVFKLFIPTPEN